MVVAGLKQHIFFGRNEKTPFRPWPDRSNPTEAAGLVGKSRVVGFYWRQTGENSEEVLYW